MAYKYSYDYEEKEMARAKLPTNRSMWKFVILHFLTLGIYGIIFFIPFTFDLEKIHPQYSKTKPMNYLWAFVLSLLTFSIVIFIWHYQTAEWVSDALKKREIEYEFGTGDFWKWFFWGSFIFVGVFVYYFKLCKAMNLLCDHYNDNPIISDKQ